MSSKLSTIVTFRVSSVLGRSIEREARRRLRTKSAVVREILEAALGARKALDVAEDAGRQSLLVSARASEREVLDWIGIGLTNS